MGESGTGKGVIADIIHHHSKRRDKPMIKVNCGAIPDSLVESELFGYKKGAFTGAVYSKKGLFAQAHKGTFFLDEISEIPLSMQVKLLRVLEKREFYPLGGDKVTKVDTRIVAASNKSLEEEIKQGRFRKDLFYRIYVIPIKLPPLRERKEDIPLLAKYFLDKFGKRMKKQIKGFSLHALQKLMLYHWPGNVRELENVVECAVAMATEDIITEDLILQTQKLDKNNLRPLKKAKEDFEKNYLIQVMKLTQGNVSQAARIAGKYRADLYEILEKYGLKPTDFRKSN